MCMRGGGFAWLNARPRVCVFWPARCCLGGGRPLADMSAASHACQNNRGEFGKLGSQKKLLCHISTSTRSQKKQQHRKGRSTGDYRGEVCWEAARGAARAGCPHQQGVVTRIWGPECSPATMLGSRGSSCSTRTPAVRLCEPHALQDIHRKMFSPLYALDSFKN